MHLHVPTTTSKPHAGFPDTLVALWLKSWLVIKKLPVQAPLVAGFFFVHEYTQLYPQIEKILVTAILQRGCKAVGSPKPVNITNLYYSSILIKTIDRKKIMNYVHQLLKLLIFYVRQNQQSISIIGSFFISYILIISYFLIISIFIMN